MSVVSRGVFFWHLTPDILASATWAWKAFFFSICVLLIFISSSFPPGTWQRWCLLLFSFPAGAVTKERKKGRGGDVDFKSWTSVLGQPPPLCIHSHFNKAANLELSGKQSLNTVWSREALCLHHTNFQLVAELKLFGQCNWTRRRYCLTYTVADFTSWCSKNKTVMIHPAWVASTLHVVLPK